MSTDGRKTFMNSINKAEPMIVKWNLHIHETPPSSTKSVSIFYDFPEEALEFLTTVTDFNTAMEVYTNDESDATDIDKENILSRAGVLMKIAIQRLLKEFYHILEAKTLSSSDESSSDLENEGSDDRRFRTQDIADLRAIAECMVKLGYRKECVKAYKVTRISIIDEGMYRLGYDKLSKSQLQKLPWSSVEVRIRKWHKSLGMVIQTLFSDEKLLSEEIFGFSDSLKESCFAKISKVRASQFLAFPSLVTSTTKKSPEKIFLFLDLYDVITSEYSSEIKSLFFKSPAFAVVKSQVLLTVEKIGQTIRTMLGNFETAIRKDTCKTLVPGGGVHPLTRYVMNYVVFLADYTQAISDIYVDIPVANYKSSLLLLPDNLLRLVITPSSPTTCSDKDGENTGASGRLSWIIMILQSKLDAKSRFYRTPGLSYLFMSNNIHYILQKVRGSSRLHLLLGEDWEMKTKEKETNYIDSYVNVGWKKVIDAIAPEDPTTAISRMKEFGKAFEEVCRCQAEWVFANEKMREMVKVKVEENVVESYRPFYDECCKGNNQSDVKFSPEEVEKNIADLYSDNVDSST